MNGRWRFPTHFLLMGTIMALLSVSFVQGSIGLAETMSELVIGEEAHEELMHVNWPAVLSGLVWITLFSVGVVGTLVNVLKALRLPTIIDDDYSALEDISSEETNEVSRWFVEGSVSMSDLPKFWGETK